jgi:hypothetical protein
VNNYGNFTGPNLSYQGVTEVDNQIPPPTPPNLFGPPALSGDSLLFLPINFDISITGGASELQDGKLTLSAAANPGKAIGSFSISEGGAYAVDDGSAATFASETLIINNLFITAVGGSSINPIVVTPTITFTHTGSAPFTTTSDSITFFGGAGLENGSWNAVATFDLAGALAAANLQGPVTGLSLALDNQLAAQTDTGGSAFIDKKNFLLTPGPGVPEPATVGLVAFGALLSLRRRKI